MKNDQLLHPDVNQELRWEPGVCTERTARSAPGAATVHDRLGTVEADGVGGRRRGRYL